MARGRSILENVPPYAQSTIDRIELMGFTDWNFFENQPLADLNRRVQVRDTDKLAPHVDVARYAASLKRGDIMPPAIFTRDGYLVDGATREAAARLVGREVYPAVRLNVNFENAPKPVIDQLTMLGTAFNMSHGRGMNKANVEAVILNVANPGDTAREIANRLGNVSEGTVQNVLSARKGRQRASDLGFNPADINLTQTHWARFGSSNLNDEVLRDLITLSIDSSVSTTDLEDMLRALRERRTDQDRLTYLASEKRTRPDSNGRPSRSGKVRRSLGFIMKFADQPELLVETDPREAADYMRVLTDTRNAIDGVLRAQWTMDRGRE
jgi:hypothetical protein